MRNLLEIITPENVKVEYELAGLGSRTVAYIIDKFITGTVLLILLAGLAMGSVDIGNIINLGTFKLRNESLLIAVYIIIYFILNTFYFILFEMIMNGQTPGKKVIGLRVIKLTGEPDDVLASFIRNFLRVIDDLPLFSIVGGLFIFFTSQYRRIGDFAGNTIVVKVEKLEKPLTIEELINETESAGDVINIYPVNNMEYGILRDYLARNKKLGDRQRVFAYHLSNYFLKKFNLQENPYSNSTEFFKEIVKMNSGI